MYVWFDGKVNPCDNDYKSYLSFGNAKDFNLKNYGIINSFQIYEINIKKIEKK